MRQDELRVVRELGPDPALARDKYGVEVWCDPECVPDGFEVVEGARP